MPSIKVFKVNPKARLPQYMSAGSSGGDVIACIDGPMDISPGERRAISTGLAFQIPEGYEIQVRPRSGLSFKKGLTLVNSPGTIDSDYRGELLVLTINLGSEVVRVEPGDRIAQLIVQRVERLEWQEVTELSPSERNEGGFGSTGK